jgi:tRNA threonylcarbamoyl adenosine modification protein YjeE
MAKDSQRFERELTLADQAATSALGARIASALSRGDCVALKGDLGSGKTTLARAILRALGVEEAVPSPTFTLLQTYETDRLSIGHYDFYRIENEREIEELGLDEALVDGAALVEWPERAPAHIPQNTLQVSLVITGTTTRRVALSGPTRWASKFEDFGAHVG